MDHGRALFLFFPLSLEMLRVLMERLTVNTLAGGTIPVNQLVTLTGSQVMYDKAIAGMVMFADTAFKSLRIYLDSASIDAHTMLIVKSTIARSIELPDASDMLMGKNTTDIMKNKTLTDVSNTVHANGIRNGATFWISTFGGAAPTTNQVLSYNGTNAVWGGASGLVTLAGDCSGAATNTVVSKATGDFAVGKILKATTAIQVKKVVVHDGGGTTGNEHNFHGFGTSDLILSISCEFNR